MKFIILILVFVYCSMNGFSQSVTYSAKERLQSSQPDKWNLSDYIWSQSHSKFSKRDKSILDFTAIDNWKGIGDDADLSVSSDGKNIAYTIRNKSSRRLEKLIVKSVAGSWQREFINVSPGFFSKDGKQYIFQDKDSLCFVQIGDNERKYVKGVVSYKKPEDRNCEWITWQLNNDENTVVLLNLLTGIENRFDSVDNYFFDKTGKLLICQLKGEAKKVLVNNLSTGKKQYFNNVTDYVFNATGEFAVFKGVNKSGNETFTELKYVDLGDGMIKNIWSSTDNDIEIKSYTLDGSGKQIIFLAHYVGNKQPQSSIWYYKIGMDKAIMEVSDQTNGNDASLFIQRAEFSDNDQYIMLTLQQRKDARQLMPDAVKLDVWGYQDTILQSMQAFHLKESKKFIEIFNPDNGQVIILENYFEKIKAIRGDFAVVGTNNSEIYSDRFWEKNYLRDSNYLVSLKDGTRKLLKTNSTKKFDFWFSPKGNYLVYFDGEQQCNYFSYDLHTRKLVNISKDIPAFHLGFQNFYQISKDKPSVSAGVFGWMQNDVGILVFDNYDIWLLDLAGDKAPLSITNGYGRSHQIKIFLEDKLTVSHLDDNIFEENQSLLLKAFNRKNKYNGFFLKKLGEVGDPELLYMGPCMISSSIEISGGMKPLKAKNANLWIVKRQTAIESPNYFATTDFKEFKKLTDLQAQKEYNWLTAELYSFKQLDGSVSQGILYKPENFDATKKYPVIITFYGQLSSKLYQYPTPAYLSAPDIFDDPAWFASHGYLIFMPDIYFTKGKWGPSALNAVEGAARFLGTLSFVDAKRMGACGHSNSGRFGYYILTHSHSFAAMSVGSGTTDIVSMALSLYDNGNGELSMLKWAEIDAYGTGLGCFWQNKDSWLDQNAVLKADKVTAPLLMYACKKNDVPVSQAIEMFVSLRRLEKRVWWLQYDDGGHRLSELRDLRDFTIRYTQFMDHYLKEGPVPKWMTKGVPASLKGIENRYEFDTEGICGKNCAVCRANRIKRLSK